MSSPSALLIIVPAAGAARRMGRPKQLLRIGGESMLHRGCRVAGELLADLPQSFSKGYVLVVTGARAERVEAHVNELRDPPSVLQFTDWAEGLGSSIAYAARHSVAEEAAAILVLLPDQPDISVDHLRRLLHRTDDRVVATDYGGRGGVPAIFPAAFLPELQQLKGDRGAQRFLQRLLAEDRLTLVAHPQGPPQDLDTPEAYHAYLKRDG